MLALSVSGFLVGCASMPDQTDRAQLVLPDLETACESFNAPVRPLDRLWARAVVQAIVETDEGTRREQGEGHLQIVRNERVALSVGKLGETYLYLACDETRYWWMDMVDGDDRVALVGTHEQVTLERLTELGLPVHPLELIELLCVTPIDVANASIAWMDEDAAISEPSRFGTRIIRMDPVTLDPVGAVLLDSDGAQTVSVSFEGVQPVRVEGLPLGAAHVPVRYVIELPSRKTTIRLRLTDPENKRILPLVYDFDKLVRRFQIDRVIDLDTGETTEISR